MTHCALATPLSLQMHISTHFHNSLKMYLPSLSLLRSEMHFTHIVLCDNMRNICITTVSATSKCSVCFQLHISIPLNFWFCFCRSFAAVYMYFVVQRCICSQLPRAVFAGAGALLFALLINSLPLAEQDFALLSNALSLNYECRCFCVKFGIVVELWNLFVYLQI